MVQTAMDSPLDFSTKRVKLENGTAVAAKSSHQTSFEEEEESRSHLRHRLSMKSPSMLENLPGAILNLSKVSPTPGWMIKSSSDSRSNSCSPPSFQASPPIFTPHHISASSTSPNLPFGTNLPSLTLPNTNGHGNHSLKARTTRPFKAYPKDPMSFSAVGLYGLPLSSTPGSSEAVIHQQSHVAYAEFRKQMLSQTQGSKSRRGGQRNNGSNGHALSDSMVSSPNDSMNYNGSSDLGANSSAEDSNHSGPEDSGHKKNGSCGSNKSEQQLKDEAYWERRRKNNEAAKRSRDARRAKEDEIAIRAAFLEQENLKLRFELCALKNETAKLRCMLYSS